MEPAFYMARFGCNCNRKEMTGKLTVIWQKTDSLMTDSSCILLLYVKNGLRCMT